MTNAEKFQEIFKKFATEVWAFPEKDFLTWLNAEYSEPIKGHWIKEKSIFGWDGHSYQCSECGRSIHLDTEMEDLEDYPYCHCGAKMQEVEE